MFIAILYSFLFFSLLLLLLLLLLLQYKIACFCYQIITGTAPQYLAELIQIYVNALLRVI